VKDGERENHSIASEGKTQDGERHHRPVFDINTMINWFYRAANPVPFLC